VKLTAILTAMLLLTTAANAAEVEETHHLFAVTQIGHLPKQWLGDWCQISGSAETHVWMLKRDKNCMEDGKTTLKETSFFEMESGCDLMDGVWDEEKKTYRTMYDCWGEGERVAFKSSPIRN
jgi:hypothetical protein